MIREPALLPGIEGAAGDGQGSASQPATIESFCIITTGANGFMRPIHERILADLRSSTKLFADETTAPVLDPGRGRTKTGQLWAYARDDRPWGGTDPPAVAYVYAPDRKGLQPIAHLAGFKGVLQVDGYVGYRALAEKGEVSLAFCWAHVQRRLYEFSTADASPIATRDAATHRPALCDRKGHPRPQPRRTSRRSTGTLPPHPRRTRAVATREARPDQPEEQQASE